MRLREMTLTTSLCIAFLGLQFNAFAAEDRPEAPKGELQRVALAAQLVEYGTKHDDPLALLSAVRIYGTIAGKVKDKKGTAVNIDNLVKRAEVLAGEDPAAAHIKGIIGEIRTKSKAWSWVPSQCYEYQWRCDWAGCRYVYVYYPC